MADDAERRRRRWLGALVASGVVVVVGLFVAGFVVGSSRSSPSSTTVAAAPATTTPCPSATQPCVVIDSPNHDTVVVGVPFSFTVTTRGDPVARLHKRGRLPRGVRFVSGTGGTATLSGSPKPTRRRRAVGAYHLVFVADAGEGATRAVATQGFVLTVVP